MSDFLRILGINVDISNVTIRILRVAFKKQALLLHPDKSGVEKKKEKTAAFQNLRAAYEELKKFIEENMKCHINRFLDKTDVILPNHHGGLTDHLTVTACAVIDYECEKAVDENKFCIVLSMDILSAFNMV